MHHDFEKPVFEHGLTKSYCISFKLLGQHEHIDTLDFALLPNSNDSQNKEMSYVT